MERDSYFEISKSQHSPKGLKMKGEKKAKNSWRSAVFSGTQRDYLSREELYCEGSFTLGGIFFGTFDKVRK